MKVRQQADIDDSAAGEGKATHNSHANWMENNERHLAATLEWLRLRLLRMIGPEDAHVEASQAGGGWFSRRRKGSLLSGENKMLPPPAAYPSDEDIAYAAREMASAEHSDPPPALEILARRLDLSAFDQKVLMLCAAMEFDTRIAGLCARAQGDPNRPYPTFALAMALFDDPEWNVLSPQAPLRYWRLIEINQPGAQALTSSALRADERIVNFLKGLNYLDDRIAPLVDSLPADIAEERLPPSQQGIVEHCSHSLHMALSSAGVPVIELIGRDSVSKMYVAGQTAARLGLNVYSLNLKLMPTSLADFLDLTRLWQRESMLMPLALYVNASDANDVQNRFLQQFLERTGGVVFVDVNDSVKLSGRPCLSYEVNKPVPTEQETLWMEALRGEADNCAAKLAAQFSLDLRDIRRLSEDALTSESGDREDLGGRIWEACVAVSQAGLDRLAQRIDAKASWDDIVLPSEQMDLLRQITKQVVARTQVYDHWGFRKKMNRGLGINALFAGESGTGKTMAAEVIANELKLNLYRIDLSSVVSKYIGETEKNLRELFDVAEESGSILFFDEADALFGKRSEVKDSHDRYANIEINYLLQRMESYRGLAILATNMKSALDKAFTRRLRFIVNFPFPGEAERVSIWRKALPPEMPTEALDLQRLARLNLTGGGIHSVVLNAAFLAAQDEHPVTMPLLLNAARSEFKKQERPTRESDFKWYDSTGVVA